MNDVNPNGPHPIHIVYIEGSWALGTKAGRPGENLVTMASLEVVRQCFVDAIISPIKGMEGFHIPGIKSLLDQHRQTCW